MSLPRLPPATAGPATSGHTPENTVPQEAQASAPAGTTSRWLGWLGGLRRLRRTAVPAAEAPPGPMAALPDEVLAQVLTATLDGDLRRSRWDQAAVQLARLRPVNRAFRQAADAVQQQLQHPEQLAHRERVWRTTAILRAALKECDQQGTTTSLARISKLDHVTVDLRLFRLQGVQDRVAAKVARDFLDALWHGPRALDVVAEGGVLLKNMMSWLRLRPGMLRSLDVQFRPPERCHAADAYASMSCPSDVGRALLTQKNLTELTLWQVRSGDSELNERLSLDNNGLADAIAGLPGLERLSLCNVGQDAATLARVLGSLPALKVLNLVADRRDEPGLDAAAFAPVVAALGTLRSLRCLHLKQILPDGTSAEKLAGSLSGLTDLQTLKLAHAGLDAAGLAQVARGLAGLQKLETVDLSGQPLPLVNCTGLIEALAAVPALRYLTLNDSRQTDVAALAIAFAPLAQRRNLQLHVQGLGQAKTSQLHAALPQLVAAAAPSQPDPDTTWHDRLAWHTYLSLA